MNTHAHETHEKKSQSAANAVSQKQSGKESPSQFVDNRPEAGAQKKRQEIANNSPRVKKFRAIQEMANNSPRVKQAAQLQALANNYVAKPIQRLEIESEELLQRKSSTKQRENAALVLQMTEAPVQKTENSKGLPDILKSGIENLSRYSLDDVNVHINSGSPSTRTAQAQGKANRQAYGQANHSPHEAGHVVQQKRGRVKYTSQMKRIGDINDDVPVEKQPGIKRVKAFQMIPLDHIGTEPNTRYEITSRPQVNTYDTPPGRHKKATEAPNVVQPKTNPASSRLNVIQRVLNKEDSDAFYKWVQEEIPLREIHKMYHEPVMKMAKYVAEEVGWVDNLEKAKQRMNRDDAFVKFEKWSKHLRLAESAILSGGATIEDVEQVLDKLGKERTERFLSKGEKCYVKRVPASAKDYNCHHFAFGGLKGKAKFFSINQLESTFGLRDLKEGGTVDASKLVPGVKDEGKFKVRRYGMAHSAREQGGLLWHKFIEKTVVFAIPAHQHLGESLTKTIYVISSKV